MPPMSHGPAPCDDRVISGTIKAHPPARHLVAQWPCAAPHYARPGGNLGTPERIAIYTQPRCTRAYSEAVRACLEADPYCLGLRQQGLI
jgi:hypothetical protein